MVRVAGGTPRFAHESERVVCEQLCRTAADDAVLIPNLRLTTTLKDHEPDVVVLMPGVGVVVVEVKGGSVTVDARGQWWTGGGTRRSRTRPVEQCRDGKYALRAFVEADPRWKARHSRVRWGTLLSCPTTPGVLGRCPGVSLRRRTRRRLSGARSAGIRLRATTSGGHRRLY